MLNDSAADQQCEYLTSHGQALQFLHRKNEQIDNGVISLDKYHIWQLKLSSLPYL